MIYYILTYGALPTVLMKTPVDEGVALLPSRRVVVSPNPGTDDADFLDNLNEAYGATTPGDDQVIEGIRRHCHGNVGRERSGRMEAASSAVVRR
jgi:hypothetical protein